MRTTIIQGITSSDKLEIANFIAENYVQKDIVMYDEMPQNSAQHTYSKCDKNTKLIIFDNSFWCDELRFSSTASSIIINKKGQDPFTISPDLIFIIR